MMFRNFMIAIHSPAFLAVVIAISAVDMSGDLLAQGRTPNDQVSDNQNEAEDLKALEKEYQLAEQRLLKARQKMKLGEIQPQRTWPSLEEISKTGMGEMQPQRTWSSWVEGQKTKFEKVRPQGEVFSRSERRPSQDRFLNSDFRSQREGTSVYESMGIEVKERSLIQIEKLKQDLRAAEKASDKDAIKNKIHSILFNEYDAFLKKHSLKLSGLKLRVRKLEADLEQRAEMMGDLVELESARIIIDAVGIEGLDSNSEEENLSQDEVNPSPVGNSSHQLIDFLSRKQFGEASELLNEISASESVEAIEAFQIARAALQCYQKHDLPDAIVAETIAVLDNAIEPGEHRPELLHLKANLQYIFGDLKEAIKTQTLAVSQPVAGLEKKQAFLTYLKSVAKPADQETPKAVTSIVIVPSS